METFLLTMMVVLGTAMSFSLIRFLLGPTTADRVVAIDTLITQIIGMLILYGMKVGSAVFYDAVLILTILGFVGTLTFAKYLIGMGNILDPEHHV